MRTCRLLLPILPWFAACSTMPESSVSDPQPARARAALATFTVENHYREQLTIFYRFASAPGAETGVGQVPAHTTAAMAPVPAGEPLILIARTPAGTQLVLPQRTFAIDDHWTWRIDADARFIRPDSMDGP
jgi:hypothetical protein